MKIQDVKVGQLVRASEHYAITGRGPDFVGSVVGVTVNGSGEPVALLSMSVLCTSTDMLGRVGWTQEDHSVWTRTAGMHPTNFELIVDGTPIVEYK
jgi:hypothetical protein